MSDLNMDQAEAKGWRPEEGDTIVGLLTAVQSGWSDYKNGTYPILVVADEAQDGTLVAVHAFHAVLFNRLMELKPRVGERIGIKYQGKTRNKADTQDVSLYTVRVEGRNVETSWSSFDQPSRGSASDVPVDPADFQPKGGASVPPNDDIPF